MVLDQPAFSVGDRSYRWKDVVAAARHWQAWQRLEQAAREGMELARQAAARGLPEQPELQAAASEFRYARDLLSADEMEEWLARWELGVDDWMAYLRRQLLRDQAAGTAAPPVDADALATATWADAVCSGELEALARRLAEYVAVFAGREGAPAGLDRLEEVEAAFERFRSDAVTEEAVRRELAGHTLEWTRLDCVWVVSPDEAVVREAALCVQEEQRDLVELARQAGLTSEEGAIYLDGSDPELVPHLLGAQPGDLVGPLARGGEFLLLVVRARTTPSTEDAELRERAERQVRERAVEDEVLRHVRWH